MPESTALFADVESLRCLACFVFFRPLQEKSTNKPPPYPNFHRIGHDEYFSLTLHGTKSVLLFSRPGFDVRRVQ